MSEKDPFSEKIGKAVFNLAGEVEKILQELIPSEETAKTMNLEKIVYPDRAAGFTEYQIGGVPMFYTEIFISDAIVKFKVVRYAHG